MKRFLGIGFLFLVAAAGWKAGEYMSTDALGMALGVIFGMMAGIPAALIAISSDRNQRVDVYHHSVTETRSEPQKQAVALILARSTNCVVIDEVQQLQTVQRNRIEVSR